MGLIEKIKLLVKIRKPAGEIAEQVKEIKRGYKTVSFWLTLVGSLLSCVAALQGIIPAGTAMLIATGLTTIYNLLRGLQKAEEAGVRPTLRATEFWIGILGTLQVGLLDLQKGGVNDGWVAVSLAVIAGAMAAAQNLGAQNPKPEPGVPA